MQLSPLQSRLAASVLASCLLILLYLSLFSPHLALAQEISSNLAPLPSIRGNLAVDGPAGPLELYGPKESLQRRAVGYEPEFAPFDRSIIGRAPPGVTGLSNNVPQLMNVEPGTSQVFVFEKASILGGAAAAAASEPSDLRRDLGGGPQVSPIVDERSTVATGGEDEVERREVLRRQATRTVYISANTCMQPQPVADTTTMEPPQLTMYISSTNPSVGEAEGGNKSNATWHVFKEGAVMVNISTAEDVFIRISAPNVATAFSGIYNFEVAASVDGSYHSFTDQVNPDLFWVDSDASAALLVTRELSTSNDSRVIDEIMARRPFVMFAHSDKDRSISGLRYSYCGLQNYAQIAATKNGKLSNLVQTSMTRRGRDNMPKQQFFLSGLNASTTYVGILATATRSNTVGGGGLVFRSTDFTTRQADGGNNCQLLSSLPFCDQVAYAVPANPTRKNATVLAAFYDDYAREMYGNFKKALAQVQCETSLTQRYSLVRGCSDCEKAYKDWLCLVTIPRCEDFFSANSNNSSSSSNGTAAKPWLFARNIDSPFPDGRRLSDAEKAGIERTAAHLSSRSPRIDAEVQPGPYRELLPCEGLCFDIVQSCPAALGFSCPTAVSKHGFKESYHVNGTAPDGGGFLCNFPGAGHFQVSAAPPRLLAGRGPSSGFLVGAAAAAALALVLV